MKIELYVKDVVVGPGFSLGGAMEKGSEDMGSSLGAMTSMVISSLAFKPASLLMWTIASWLASLSPVSHLF